MCCLLGVEWGGAGVLSSRTKAQLQRDIVHLSQISCLCDCLSTLSPSSVGKNTLSCGCEITGIYVVVYQWACQRIKKRRIFPAWSCREDLVPWTESEKPWWFSFPDRCSVYTTVYMIPLDAQSSPSLEIRQEEGTNLQIQESILDGYKTKGGGGDGHALLIASFYFFSFPVSSLNILLTAIKT